MYLLRFLILPVFAALFLLSFLLGGRWLWLSAAALMLMATVVDENVPDDEAVAKTVPGPLAYALPLVHLPGLAIATFLAAYYLSAWTFLGEAINDARERTLPRQFFLMMVALGVYYGLAGFNIAHELIHRTDRLSQFAGRWLLSFSLDPGFVVEHIHNHHRNVGTPKDFATAPRGMGFWSFFMRMFVDGNRSAWAIETRLLEKKGKSAWNWSNRIVSGAAMSAVWLVLFAIAAGVWGILFYLVAALVGKIFLDATNYLQHYGVVRAPGRPIEARHSWNSNRRLSSWTLFNLPRHSHHHLSPHRAFWELRPQPDGPMLPYGYFVTGLTALVPPLYRRMMAKPLEAWDRDFASAEERQLLAETSR